ncbi:ABC1-domain-containing protein [Sparassis latifolia]
MVIALDYKWNFTPEMSESIPALHERVAEMVYDLFTANGGLYIKIGQAFANNAALMPRPMQEKFSKLFDDAPQVPYSVVKKVFESEFGKPPDGPDGVFEYFDERAAASASIAQVHRAKLKATDGTEQWVAVKIQKPDVSKQVGWDLGAFRLVMWVYENYLFDLPVYFVVDFISDHLRRELDFELEAQNAMKMADFVAAEPRLAKRVYIPKVFTELSSKRVMVAEWIDGVRLSDRAGIMQLMGEEDSRSLTSASSQLYQGTPLKGGVKAIMQTMVDLFSAQIFEWGWVHCDPHPGNIIIRPHPANPTIPQFVLLDHGLYVRVSDTFRKQYATLWEGLLTVNFDVVKDVAEQWGIGTPDLFASATLMRPVKFANQDNGENFEQMDQYERSMRMKEKLKGFLTDTDKMPKALIFIGRNMRIVQGNNQLLGSPVNRIRITGSWASRSLTELPNLSWRQRVREYLRYLTFLAVTWSIDVAFWISKVRQWTRVRLGLKGEGFEDELERTMRGFAKTNFGVEIAADAFEG